MGHQVGIERQGFTREYNQCLIALWAWANNQRVTLWKYELSLNTAVRTLYFNYIYHKEQSPM